MSGLNVPSASPPSEAAAPGLHQQDPWEWGSSGGVGGERRQDTAIFVLDCPPVGRHTDGAIT